MSRYPRPVRDPLVKCVACNAPAAETTDGEYVCVECGASPIQGDGAPELRQDGGFSWSGERVPPASAGGNADVVASRTDGAEPAGPSPTDAETGRADGFESPLLGADSATDPAVSFVLPTKDEEEGIGECIDRAARAAERLGVLAEVIVSDSSTDRTPEIARSRGAIVVEPDAPGYGAAYRYAFEHARGDVIVMGDADTTYDFEQLPALLEPIERGEADLVMGSRFDGEIEPGAMPALHRYVGNPLLTKFLNVFYAADVSDAHTGFRVFTREALEAFTFRSDGMEFASEMVMDAAVNDLRIAEVPITYHAREGDAELDSLRDGWRHVKFMLVNAPTYLFAVPGVAFALLGALAMLLSLSGIQPGPVTFGTYTMIAGSLLTVVGYQVALLSVFNCLAADPIMAADGRIMRWIETNFSLERGATLGLALTAFGVGYAVSLLVRWSASGYAQLPPVTAVVFTSVVLGLETLFSSFHLSALR